MNSVRRIAPWVLAGLVLGGCSPEALPERPPTLVATTVVSVQPRQVVTRLTGDVQARVSTELSFRVSGRVTERLVDVGGHVKAGDVLARIDPTEQQADLEGSKAGVAAAEAQVRAASATFERQKTLMAGGFTTRATYDQAQEALRTAQGSLDVAKAQLGTSTDALSYTELRASAAGLITARNIEVGQVAQSAQSAYTLAEDGGRDGVFDIYESVFLRAPESDVINMTLVSNPAVSARGRIRQISPTVDPKTATVKVKVAIDNAPDAMTLGSAIIGEGREKPRGTIVLPWSALTITATGAAVWLVDPSTSVVSLREIQVDSYETNSFVVDRGLQAGDRVVTNGGKFLRPGLRVTFEKDKSS